MIHVLDEKTINQIAAGEVIERPMAVVKELVENAIDAGANAVTVEIKEGGLSFIRVTDNGSGIRREEIPTAFLRHATSKIRTMEDLLTAHSLGFRGEALSSIAAVAQVELVTRQADEITGSRYEIEGGKEKSREEVGCPSGSTFIVRNLFFNTPARRKFLKTKTTEGNYVQDLMLRYSLAHAEIRFHFISDGRTRLQTSGDGQIKTNIYYNYGADVTKCLVPVEGKGEGMTLRGFLGKPELSRGNRTFMNYFVNGRYIKSPVISSAIEQGYRDYLMNHRYPFTVLLLDIDSRFIDVNVHPTKMEVRFSNREEVYDLFHDTVKSAMQRITLIPEVELGGKKEKKPVSAPKNSVSREAEPFEQIRRDRECGMVREADSWAGESAVQSAAGRAEDRARQSGVADAEEGVVRGAVGSAGQSAASGPEDRARQSRVAGAGESAVRGAASGMEDRARQNGVAGAGESAVQSTASGTEDRARQNGVSGTGEGAVQSLEDLARQSRISGADESVAQSAAGSAEESASRRIDENRIGSQIDFLQANLLKEEAGKTARFRMIGQVFGTYWLLEYESELLIIDQHAAHEKVLYEKLMKRLREQSGVTQNLAAPIVVTLTGREMETLREHREVFERIGFRLEPFGDREYILNGVPADFLDLVSRERFLEILDALMAEGKRKEPELILDRVATMACKAAVKGKQNLSFAEAEALLGEMLEAEEPYHCPHGRPTTIAMSRQEFEKKFKRTL